VCEADVLHRCYGEGTVVDVEFADISGDIYVWIVLHIQIVVERDELQGMFSEKGVNER
jgi:hypothetical protein